jgi:hypothetical protein
MPPRISPRTRSAAGRLSALLIACLSIVATSLAIASPAHAAYVGNGKIRNWASGLCLEAVPGGPLAWEVHAKPCRAQKTGDKYQTWEPTYTGS